MVVAFKKGGEGLQVGWAGGYLLGVPQSDISAQTGKCSWGTPPMTLSPHELVQVCWHHRLVDALHSLEAPLHPRPVRLDVLCVHTCGLDDEVQ